MKTLVQRLSPLWKVIRSVRAYASVTAGFIWPPPYFQNIQTSDVVAIHVLSAALNNAESSVVCSTCGVALDETSEALKLSTSWCQSTVMNNCVLISRNVARSSALTPRQKSRLNIYNSISTSQYRAKVVRSTDPLCGKVCHLLCATVACDWTSSSSDWKIIFSDMMMMMMMMMTMMICNDLMCT